MPTGKDKSAVLLSTAEYFTFSFNPEMVIYADVN